MTQPQLDPILDLSTDPQKGWSAAEAFLSARIDTSLHFFIVVGG